MKAHLIRNRLPLALFAIAISLTLSSSLQAALSGYIKIGDIDGESAHSLYEGYIEVQSLTWGVERTASSTDSTRTRDAPSFADLTIVKPIDKATPKLFEACAMGIVVAECELTLLRSNSSGAEEVHLRIILKNVIVSSTSMEVFNPSLDDRESVSLNFEEVEMEYFVPGSSQEVVTMSYNLQTGTP